MLTNIILKISFLIPALIQTESNNNWNAVNQYNNSFGGLQITQVVIDDLNRIKGQQQYFIDDSYDENKSKEICQQYLLHYAIKYYRSTGNMPDYEQLARIWNGGPNGWSKHSTSIYWEKVEKYLP